MIKIISKKEYNKLVEEIKVRNYIVGERTSEFNKLCEEFNEIKAENDTLKKENITLKSKITKLENQIKKIQDEEKSDKQLVKETLKEIHKKHIERKEEKNVKKTK